MLGEIHEAAQFAARPLSKLILKVEQRDPETGEWEDTEDAKAMAALDRIKGPGGDRSELLYSYGQLMWLVGESYLVGTIADDEEAWEFLSTAELKPIPGERGKYQRFAYPGATPSELVEATEDDYEPLPNEVVVYRYWRRHPRYSLAADSAMRGVLDVCAELEILTKAVRGEALSRLAKAGILFLDEQMSMPSLEAGPDEDPDEDPLIRDLTEAAREAIRDPSAASAMVPIVIRTNAGPEGFDKRIRHVTFGSGANQYPEAKLRDEAINRLAIGLDMPIEALTGASGVNHWTGWLIDDQSWRVHVQPFADIFVQNTTSVVFRPMLESDGVSDPDLFRIGYDASSIVTNSDRSKDAKDLHDRGSLSDRALRDAGGFDDEDAPSEEEPNSNPRVIMALARAAGYGGPAEATGVATPASPTPSESGPADVTPLPPNEGQPALAASASLEARIEGAAQVAVDNCRKVAGSRIRSRAARDPQVLAQLKKVPNRMVASVIGGDVLAQVYPEARLIELVAGGAETFHSALIAWGLPEQDADEMTKLVEAHAAATLLDPEPPCVPCELTAEGCAA